ncbi:hypothetical protein [Tamlana sp. I1]|uniref:hypothetical protein n=1 Tax=Tamlana sp. I1 TaxID=2762061 RepID=UPI0018906077|nr:hypothetical protein [Tamlana sp. I1]
MKNVKLLCASLMLLLSISLSATELKLDLKNPDVRKCLLEAASNQGWLLDTVYQDSEGNLVFILTKGEETRTYTSL